MARRVSSSTGVDKSKRALVLSRLHHLKRNESLFEVSNVIGLIQKDNCYLGQLEMRWGKDGRVLHAKRSQQHAGPLLENGFPSMATIELVQTSTDKRTNSSQMVRIVLVYPASREEAARIRVHLVGDLRRQTGGRVQTRRVHVVSEFTRGGGIKIWTSIGEKNPFISWEEAITYKHEHDWQNAGSGSQTGSHKWERPFHPYSPKNRGVRPIPMVALLVAALGVPLALVVAPTQVHRQGQPVALDPLQAASPATASSKARSGSSPRSCRCWRQRGST